MKYLVAIGAGALLALLPPLLLVSPYLAWEHACMRFANTSPAALEAGDAVEDPCWLIHETLEPLWLQLLITMVLTITCCVSGALAARISEKRRWVVAFLAPFLAYLLLISWGASSASVSSLEVAVPFVAGLLGVAGTGWQHLTNAWRATRSKQRAPQA